MMNSDSGSRGFLVSYVHSLSTKCIERFFLSIQAPYGMNVPVVSSMVKTVPAPISREGVFYSALSFI